MGNEDHNKAQLYLAQMRKKTALIPETPNDKKKGVEYQCDLSRNLDHWLIQSVKRFMLKSLIEHESFLNSIFSEKAICLQRTKMITAKANHDKEMWDKEIICE